MKTTSKASHGWSSPETYSVAKAILHSKDLCIKASQFRKCSKKETATYASFVKFADLTDKRTPDGIDFLNLRVNDFEIINGVIYN